MTTETIMALADAYALILDNGCGEHRAALLAAVEKLEQEIERLKVESAQNFKSFHETCVISAQRGAECDALRAENEQLREQNTNVDAACAKLEAENAGAEAVNKASALEIVRLTTCLKKANDQAEEFERKWYLSTDELEQERTDYKSKCAELELVHEALDAAKADAQRYLEKLIECRSSVKIAANEFDRFMLRKQPHANQCDIDEQKRLYELLNWIDAAMEPTK